MSTLNSKRTSRVHFEDAVDVAEDADLVTKKNKSRYWSKGERRYSEAEKAFLSRVRIRSVVGRNRQRKFGCLTFFDPAAFSQLNNDFFVVWLVLDYGCDIIYIADIVVSMRTGFLEEGILQTNSRKLRNHYIRSASFFIDAAAIVPLDLLYIFIRYIPAVRINRVVKFHRFWHFLDRTESRTTFPNVIRLASLVHFILMIIHWNACVYFMVSKEIGFGTDNWVYPGISGELESNSSYNSLSRQYIYSFYWSTLTLTTIGEVNPPYTIVEYVIVTFDYLIGDYVCRKGEVGREMYIVNRGKLEVVSERGTKIFAALEAGSYFGEISLLCMSSAGNRRTASVRSVGYTELFCLSKNDLTEVLNEYPSIKEKIEKVALQKLENDKRRISTKAFTATNIQVASIQGQVIEEKEFTKLKKKVEKLESVKEELCEELHKQKTEYHERLVTLETALSELLWKRTNDDFPSSLKTSSESVWKKR
ncbi:hypothetical protein QZH41_005354 [Actinostola sp. cb2023]|nr:hypothetical protein QZH41_005354 [Actinostola sp. cb2023]